ncbi:hypothetical protein NS303_18325 [Pantoea ananatis]|uniref:hypothetical protein n=1 Tax=Pantoea ananas TaxID=553 RepID=UPI000736D3E6|nr:hypothetical protein [Pantoea ananatis]KTR46612.1 hypothetical protein NS303_18325 [Pantoea ananatis]KTR54701.1 hypothetical protein NS311_14740 [Pantoea ananatis]KTR66853.1 hypothetical protein RSA47_01750 [Pantoea ananatis]KTR68999.1 hypothetical protein NS296_17175 [Pantoea ananatis]
MARSAGQSYRISLLAVVCVLVFEVGFHACVTVSCSAFRKADHKVDQDDMGNGTQKRSLKKSYHWYKKLIASNGEDTGC